ncbi:UDP-glucosyl transferase [Klebsormidium nitens]|uniref:UDP-glucosyl transferase n=1 Tax=Klebsormidium nitens TaxID=105231 RepID=A0A1Y1INQ3_KLENI|nr:UDP-glucosyl transferase [Klebsormidium nitens]|eukprot:GAQ90247.1 UDP-glucosyl transferase [Klebsormidium nitens]
MCSANCLGRQAFLTLLAILVFLSNFANTYAAPVNARFKTLGPKDELPRLTVYVISPPFAGHYIPLLSIASELHLRGHNVTFLAQVQRDNEDVPKRSVSEAGIAFRALGFTPLNKTELEDIVNQTRSGTNLLGAVKHFSEADTSAYVDLDKLLTHEPHPDVLVVCNVYRGMGTSIYRKHGIPVVLNYMLENYFWRPHWPYPVLGSGLSDRMTFPQRLKNELVSFVNSYLIEPYLVRTHIPETLRKHGLNPRNGLRTIFDMHGMPSILNAAPGFDFPAPLPPNVIQTGPLTVPTMQAFPKPLQAWLDSKPVKSVVLVSLGTVNVIDERIARLIVEGLGATRVNVLWALRGVYQETLAGLNVPSTFRLKEWIPQRAVLAHRAVAAMVTHCGNNGVQEALANAVPPVGIPFVADQTDVGARLAAAGFPVLNLATVTPSELTSAVQKVTSAGPDGVNEYQQKAQRLARIFRAYGGVEKAADFVEHIAEVGSDHLQMAGLSMPWYVRHRYDTGLFLLVLVGLLLLGVVKLFTGVYKGFRALVSNKNKTD